jgi:hypothetical protein
LTAWWDTADATKKTKTWENVEAWKYYTVDNGAAVNYVKSITYTDGDTNVVTLLDTNSKDFFKTNGENEDLLRAYKAKD